MFTKIRITLDRIEVADRGVLFAWAVWAVVTVGFGVEALRDWNGATGGETMWERWFATVGFAFVLASAWRLRGLRLARCRFDAPSRRADFERISLRGAERRSIGFDEIADVVVREGPGSDGNLIRGVHVVTHEGERIDVIATDQTDADRFTPLANALREMLARPARATPPPSQPRA